MWHEIRKQERKIRCMIVDYKRRAERRRDYYEKIKADPTQFLQIHGRTCKIHLDPQIAAAGDSPAVMMTWQGSPDVVIDRFDVRAHLDHIPEPNDTPEEKLSYDERLINYERYRILVQNDFLGVGEEKFLHQLYLEEQFGVVKTEPPPVEGKKKVQGATIGYNYEDPCDIPVLTPGADVASSSSAAILSVPPLEVEPTEEDEEEDSDIDFDMCVDVNKVSTQQAHELNNCGHIYGMDGNDFFSFLTKDKEEADNLRLAKELEEEKAMYSGRKSRRERRAYRDKKLAGRKISPPSYASRKSPTYRDYCELGSRSRSKSASPVNSGKITYITSFSGEEQPTTISPHPVKPPPPPKISPEDQTRVVNYRARSPEVKRYSRVRSRSRSRSYELVRRRYSRSLSRSRSRSRSRSSSRYRRRSRSPPRHYLKGTPVLSTTSHNRDRYSSSRSISKSPVRTSTRPCFNPSVPIKQPPAPIISRYYGRRGRSSSSELSISSEEEKNTRGSYHKIDKKPWSDFGNTSGRNKSGPSTSSSSSMPRMTPQERLKKKMQTLLNKQYKADKKAEREKREKEEQERIDREDEMREMSIKLRKRERRRRHEHMCERRRSGSPVSGSSMSSRSRSRSWSSSPRRRRRRHSYSRSRSRSRSRSSSRSRSEERFEGPRPLVDY